MHWRSTSLSVNRSPVSPLLLLPWHAHSFFWWISWNISFVLIQWKLNATPGKWQDRGRKRSNRPYRKWLFDFNTWHSCKTLLLAYLEYVLTTHFFCWYLSKFILIVRSFSELRRTELLLRHFSRVNTILNRTTLVPSEWAAMCFFEKWKVVIFLRFPIDRACKRRLFTEKKKNFLNQRLLIINDVQRNYQW